MTFDNTYVKINMDAITRNFSAVQEKTGVPVMAIVKANAYGHGAIQTARLLQGKCAFFGVSSMAEALELRRAGLHDPILILGHTPPASFSETIRQQIRPTIFCYNDALALSDAAVKLGASAHFHFAVDTGMGRIGFPPTEESADLCARIAQLPGLVAEGVFSHFATADCADLSAARKQETLFDTFNAMLKARGVNIPIRHMDNSAGIINFPCRYELARAGIVMYGMYPSQEVNKNLLALTPALEWESHITHVKTLGAGCGISYGATYITDRPTVVATIPVGYADGYPRNLSNRFYVLIRGQKAPILGRICMDQMMVDVTHIPGIAPGETVTLIGKSGDNCITVEEIAAAADSFNYEFVCGISRRVPRFYYQDGKEVAAVHYLLDE